MRDQLVAAIGKEVTSKDVDEYTHYITQKMLLPEAAPTPLAYSVRRSSDHSPEGMYTLEHTFPHSSSRTTPLYALTRQVASSSDIATTPHSHMLSHLTRLHTFASVVTSTYMLTYTTRSPTLLHSHWMKLQ